MKIGQFMGIYCEDILIKSASAESANLEFEFPYDYEITTELGDKVKVIYAGNDEIPIMDIITLGTSDFRRFYPSEEAYDAYRQYLEAFVILEGEEVLNSIRNSILKQKEKLNKYSSISLEGFL